MFCHFIIHCQFEHDHEHPKRFWSFLKSAKNGRRGLSTLVVGNAEITDDQDKANALNSVFASKFTSDTVTVLPDCPSYDLPPLVNIECSRGGWAWIGHFFLHRP